MACLSTSARAGEATFTSLKTLCVERLSGFDLDDGQSRQPKSRVQILDDVFIAIVMSADLGVFCQLAV